MSYTWIAPPKHPFDEKRHAIDWSADLEPDEVIAGLPVVEVAPAGLVIDELAVEGAVVSFTVSGGVHGKDYLATFKITTTGPEKDAKTIRYRVRNR
jgi:hypothetical protein